MNKLRISGVAGVGGWMPRASIRRSTRIGALLLAATITYAQGPLSGGALAAGQTATVGSPHDMVITGYGDGMGYHLYVARADGGWEWQPLATIFPPPCPRRSTGGDAVPYRRRAVRRSGDRAATCRERGANR